MKVRVVSSVLQDVLHFTVVYIHDPKKHLLHSYLFIHIN